MKAIHSQKAPAAIGPYSQAIEKNGVIYVSGQLPIDQTTGNLVEAEITAQTKQSLENIRFILEEAGLTLADVVSTTVLLSDMALFQGMNEVYASYFSAPFPARAAFAVKELPKQALVEITAVAVRP